MTYAKTYAKGVCAKDVRIAGCERGLTAHVNVDLWSPKTIGQHPTSPDVICEKSPLLDRGDFGSIELNVDVTGNKTNEVGGGQHAEVLIYCSEFQCPLHK